MPAYPMYISLGISTSARRNSWGDRYETAVDTAIREAYEENVGHPAKTLYPSGVGLAQWSYPCRVGTRRNMSKADRDVFAPHIARCVTPELVAA